MRVTEVYWLVSGTPICYCGVVVGVWDSCMGYCSVVVYVWDYCVSD